jgi:3-hydroxyacyl-CoA dehydrogenase
MTAKYEVHGSIAVITLENPPVNGLGYATRVSITDGLQKAAADGAVKAIVLTAAGKTFSGGADIKEFGSPKALAEPNLPSIILALEHSSKPVVAAIHSVCMGGGLELAPACHYRIAAPGFSVVLPEVKPAQIQGQKLFDKIAGSVKTLAQEALAFAQAVFDTRPPPLVRLLPCKHPNDDAYFQFARKMELLVVSKTFPASGKRSTPTCWPMPGWSKTSQRFTGTCCRPPNKSQAIWHFAQANGRVRRGQPG